MTPFAAPKPCLPGSLAWQEYELTLNSGSTVTLIFSLADPEDKIMGRLKKAHAVSHLGLLLILDDPDSPEDVVVWLHRTPSLTLMSRKGDPIIGAELSSLLPSYFAAFFDEVKDLAPDLAGAKLAGPGTAGKTLH